MGVTILTGDQRTKEAKHWPTWLGKVPEVRRRFHAWSRTYLACLKYCRLITGANKAQMVPDW